MPRHEKLENVAFSVSRVSFTPRMLPTKKDNRMGGVNLERIRPDTPVGPVYRAVSSAEERLLYTQRVGGSIPSPPTT
jgi:hypothetical protein